MSRLKLVPDPRPYQDDINDLVENDLNKGRGPDKQKRKARGVIGSTRSGKEIHAHNAFNHRHADFTADDHHDAVHALRQHLPEA